MSTIAERVALGAKFLDEHDPEWWRPDVERAIDLQSLDLGSGNVCVLGQRCPLETLAGYLHHEPDDHNDYAYKYHAYARFLTGMSQSDRDALEEWAAARGFNRPYGEENVQYRALTVEWRRVITGRRELTP